MSGALTVAVDARSLLCAQPRGEGKSLLRLYEEIVRQRPGVQPVFFGDARAAAFTGRLPAGTRRAGSARFGDRWNLWEDVYFPIAARRAGCAGSGTMLTDAVMTALRFSRRPAR